MRSLILIGMLCTTVIWAEPSVYGNSGSYASSKKNHNDILSLREEIAQLKQEMEGLRSIVEGLSQSLNQMQHQRQNEGSSKADSKLLQDLGAMIDKIDRTYVSKSELKKALRVAM